MAMVNKIFMGLCIILLAGCATKSQFIYDHPDENTLASQQELIALVMPVNDLREDEKEIDQIFADDPLLEIQKIIKEEIASTGYFSEVILQQENQPVVNADIIFVPHLRKMQWMVPDYDDMIGKVYIISFLTGGIGGVAYGSTETDVIGDVELKLEIIEQSTNDVLHEKIHSGHHKQKMAKMNCDAPETKATVVGKSLKNAMVELSSDLNEVFADYLMINSEMVSE